VRNEAGRLLGLDKQVKEQPHRLHKTKMKFTAQRSSLKKDKQLFHRATRSRAKQSLKTGKEILPEQKSSIRWDYW
jgi:hypothetical protein